MELFMWLIIYKIVNITVGFGLAYLGYKLFVKGIYEKSGELSGKFFSVRVMVKQAAPGIFFALFGTTIIIFAIVKGVTFDSSLMANPPAIVSTSDVVTVRNIEDGLNGRRKLSEEELKRANLLIKRILMSLDRGQTDVRYHTAVSPSRP